MPQPPTHPLHASHTSILGETAEGNAIGCYWYNTPAQKVPSAQLHALFIGAFHGDEAISTALLEVFMRWLEKTGTQEPVTQPFAIIPCLNVDGYHAGTRVNARGVDLNRNWPTQNWHQGDREATSDYYGGPEPASEPETRLLQAFIQTHQPQRIISVHSPYKVINFDAPDSAEARALAEAMAACNGYPVVESIGYPTPGSFGTWAGVEQGLLVITLELPDNEPVNKVTEDNLAALLAVLQA